MKKTIREYYSFVPADKETTWDSIEERYGKFRTASNEKTVERLYKFEDGSSIKLYKDTIENGKKTRNGKVTIYGRNEDYRELREKDMRLNRNPVEEGNADSPLIADLNFNHQMIGSDEAGKGETFKYLVVTASYVNGADDVKRYIEMGIDDSKQTKGKIPKLGEILTGIHSWEELLENLNEDHLFVTDFSATKIITNEEYNKRHFEGKENVNDILKEAHIAVLREVFKRHPDSRIAVDDFYDGKETPVQELKEEMASGDFSIDPAHVFVTVKADFKIMAVSLSSVISAYIRDLSYSHVQGIADAAMKDSEEKLSLCEGSLEPEALSAFFSKLKPDMLEEFADKYAKKELEKR